MRVAGFLEAAGEQQVGEPALAADVLAGGLRPALPRGEQGGAELDVVGPAPAAFVEPAAEGIRWFIGDAPSLPPLQVDLVTMTGNVAQVFTQIWGVAATIAWCAVASFVILKVIDTAIGLRVGREEEIEGLDLNLHGEVVP